MTRPHTAPARARRLSAAAGGGLLSLGLVLTGCAAQDAAPSAASDASNTFLDGVLATPSATSANPLQTDIEYATMLLRNQYDAAELSDTLVERDLGDDEAVSMARRVKQEAEARISTLSDRLTGWGVPVPERPEPVTPDQDAPATETMTPEQREQVIADIPRDRRAGLRTDDEKHALVTAADDDAVGVFLMQLHRVQQGAVTISGTERDEGTDEATKQTAQEVLDSHEQSMQRLVEMLAERGLIGADGPETAPPSGFTGPISMSAVGGDGGNVLDFTPTKLQSVSSQAARVSATASASADASASPTPTPADTARPTPAPADSGPAPAATDAPSPDAPATATSSAGTLPPSSSAAQG